jgi:hypothetical protein
MLTIALLALLCASASANASKWDAITLSMGSWEGSPLHCCWLRFWDTCLG